MMLQLRSNPRLNTDDTHPPRSSSYHRPGDGTVADPSCSHVFFRFLPSDLLCCQVDGWEKNPSTLKQTMTSRLRALVDALRRARFRYHGVDNERTNAASRGRESAALVVRGGGGGWGRATLTLEGPFHSSSLPLHRRPHRPRYKLQVQYAKKR